MAGKILITGIDGFIGTHLRHHAESLGYEVCGISPCEHEDSRILTVDIRNRQACCEALQALAPNYIVHLAAISFVPHGNIDDIYAINVVGSENVLQAAALLPDLRGMFLASSAAVYGHAGSEPIKESGALSPVNHYGISKLAMEQVAGIWQDQLPPLVIGRLFNCTGAGQNPKFLVPKLVQHFAERQETIELGNINVIRDFSDVHFTVAAMLQLLMNSEHAGVYNLCSGQGWSLKQILNQLSELADYKPKIHCNQALVRAGDIPVLLGDGERLRQALPNLEVIPLTETLRDMYEYQLLAINA